MLVVDPVQDYYESATVLGVFRSPRVARYAALRLMKRAWRDWPDREVEVQEWLGSDLMRVWTWRPSRGTWVMCYRSGIEASTCKNDSHDHAEPEAWHPGIPQ